MDMKKTRPSKVLFIAGSVVIILIVFYSVVLTIKWPFTAFNVTRSLEDALSSKVHFAGMKHTFFPFPGCILEDVAATRDSSGEPLLAARSVTLRGSWSDLLFFRHYLDSINIESLRINVAGHIPPPLQMNGKRDSTMVGRLVANAGELRYTSDGRLLRYEIGELTAEEVARNHPARFRIAVRIPEPNGDLTARGTFGPVQPDHAQVPLSGSFELIRADLSPFHGVAGHISSKGSFMGRLGALEFLGDLNIPDFEVDNNQHPVQLIAQYKAEVNATTGDTQLPMVNAKFLHTDLRATGRIQHESDKEGMTATLDFAGAPADVHDLLRLAVKSNQPPLSGPINFHAHVVLPPDGSSFLHRVRLDGDFSIPHAKFASRETDQKVAQLSARAQGERVDSKHPQVFDSVESSLRGRVNLRDGVARFTDTAFGVPGADAVGGGTFNVISHVVNLHGQLTMDARLSESTHGIKSVLLKPFDSLFRNKTQQTTHLPVHLTGTYSRPSFGTSVVSGK